MSASQDIVCFKVFCPIISHYVQAYGNSRSANAHVCKKLNVAGIKFPHLIFASQFPDARPGNLIFLANAQETEILFSWSSLAYKNANVPIGFFLAFFYAGTHDVNYLFFCLDFSVYKPYSKGVMFYGYVKIDFLLLSTSLNFMQK
ncbi:hypothetical protein [Elizabethkingia ursingii]|uniref:hypothetical protein n=1 Tax=Elizabethkingia ursingii TaxID=1756150 RepID=UPI0020123765|nr:hypothetical protein [Elizabethkingia ursingii]MCL1672325.1 hypothetical protein [Elizabethkingia ursingii]